MKISDCRNVKNLIKLAGRTSTRAKLLELSLQSEKCSLSDKHMQEFKWAMYERLKYFKDREEKQANKRN